MQRHKNAGSPRPPRPNGSWWAGAIIGTAIIAMTATSLAMGTAAAIRDAALKDD